MLRLVELHVRKFRDLVDGGPLRFGPGPVFLLGPNGSGKTTLLELIAVLLGDDLGPLFKEEDAVELSWVLEAEGEGETPTTRLELSLSIDAMPRSTTTDARTAKRARRGWKISGMFNSRRAGEATIHFSQAWDTDPLFHFIPPHPTELPEWDYDQPTEEGWLNSTIWLLANSIVSNYDDAAAEDHLIGIERLQLHEYLSGTVLRFDEALLGYERITGNQLDTIGIEKHGDWIDAPSDMPEWIPLPNLIDTQTNEHPNPNLLTRLLGATRVEFRPRLVSDDGRGHRRWRGFDIYVHWGGGAIHHHSELSFGQKRLIALIWRMGVGDHLPLITDEMTNGLHAGWVQAIIDHIGPRQGFHAVQNPLLLDRYGPGQSAEEIAGRFVLCTVEPGERGRQWRWRSPTPVECERLWAAYIAGFQHLSELLISEGLW